MGRATRVDFCCCVFPLINAGVYATVLWTAAVSLSLGIIAVAAPTIVATTGAIPSGWPKIIVLVLCLILFLWQFVGILSIRQEAAALYRTYVRITFLLVLALIAATVAFLAWTAARHSSANTSCVALYANDPTGGTSLIDSNSLGADICNIWLWVQVGLMGLMIALVGLIQLYMCYMQKVYGQEQRQAIRDYKAFGGDGVGDDGIPLAARDSAIWDVPSNNVAGAGARGSRGSYDYGVGAQGQRGEYDQSNAYADPYAAQQRRGTYDSDKHTPYADEGRYDDYAAQQPYSAAGAAAPQYAGQNQGYYAGGAGGYEDPNYHSAASAARHGRQQSSGYYAQ